MRRFTLYWVGRYCAISINERCNLQTALWKRHQHLGNLSGPEGTNENRVICHPVVDNPTPSQQPAVAAKSTLWAYRVQSRKSDQGLGFLNNQFRVSEREI